MRAVASKRAISKPAVRRLQFLRNAGCDRASALRAGTRAVGAPLMRFQFVAGLKLGEKRFSSAPGYPRFPAPYKFRGSTVQWRLCTPSAGSSSSRPTFAHALASRQSTPYPSKRRTLFRVARARSFHSTKSSIAPRVEPLRPSAAKPIPSPRGLVSVVSPCGVSGRTLSVHAGFAMVSDGLAEGVPATTRLVEELGPSLGVRNPICITRVSEYRPWAT